MAATVTPPADITVRQLDGSGTPAADVTIAAFLSGAIAVDAVDGPLVITHDAPAVFPPAATTVTFTATDAVGNTSSASATVTVVAAADSAQPALHLRNEEVINCETITYFSDYAPLWAGPCPDESNLKRNYSPLI